ncbi:hypothetical protein GCM10007918_42410 [Piscinibacter gummiphilus]|nr:hypothetical protein GCM10007918_42410 [Piscinibacter gummiphilus]
MLDRLSEDVTRAAAGFFAGDAFGVDLDADLAAGLAEVLGRAGVATGGMGRDSIEVIGRSASRKGCATALGSGVARAGSPQRQETP